MIIDMNGVLHKGNVDMNVSKHKGNLLNIREAKMTGNERDCSYMVFQNER